MTNDILTNDARLKKLRTEYNRAECGQVRYDVNFLFAHILAQAARIEELERSWDAPGVLCNGCMVVAPTPHKVDCPL